MRSQEKTTPACGLLLLGAEGDCVHCHVRGTWGSAHMALATSNTRGGRQRLKTKRGSELHCIAPTAILHILDLALHPRPPTHHTSVTIKHDHKRTWVSAPAAAQPPGHSVTYAVRPCTRSPPTSVSATLDTYGLYCGLFTACGTGSTQSHLPHCLLQFSRQGKPATRGLY